MRAVDQPDRGVRVALSIDWVAAARILLVIPNVLLTVNGLIGGQVHRFPRLRWLRQCRIQQVCEASAVGVRRGDP